MLDIYRRIEDWHGAPDPDYRGTGGPVYVEPAPDPNPIAPAALEGARSVGIPTFENQNGAHDGGRGRRVDPRCANPRRIPAIGIPLLRFPLPGPAQPDRPHRRAGDARSTFERQRGPPAWSSFTTGKSAGSARIRGGALAGRHPHPEGADAIGHRRPGRVAGDTASRCVQHLPGVGQNLQDHLAFDCVWEYQQPLPPRNSGVRRPIFWKSDPGLDTPDLQAGQGESPRSTAETAARFDVPELGWSLGRRASCDRKAAATSV